MSRSLLTTLLFFMITLTAAAAPEPSSPLSADSESTTFSYAALNPRQKTMYKRVYKSFLYHQLNLHAGPFLEMDTSRNNRISRSEVLGHGSDEAKARKSNPRKLQNQGLQYLQDMDLNNDGVATLEELRTIANAKARETADDYIRKALLFDKNGDGYIKNSELHALGEAQARETWKGQDKNGDGKWTIEEIFGKPTIKESVAHFKNTQVRNMHEKLWSEQWQALDTDKDGFASLEDRLRVHRRNPPRTASNYSRKPQIYKSYTLFKDRVQFALTGKRSADIRKKYHR